MGKITGTGIFPVDPTAGADEDEETGRGSGSRREVGGTIMFGRPADDPTEFDDCRSDRLGTGRGGGEGPLVLGPVELTTLALVVVPIVTMTLFEVKAADDRDSEEDSDEDWALELEKRVSRKEASPGDDCRDCRLGVLVEDEDEDDDDEVAGGGAVLFVTI